MNNSSRTKQGQFPKVFPDPSTAPLLARTIYFRLKARWDRRVDKRNREHVIESREDCKD